MTREEEHAPQAHNGRNSGRKSRAQPQYRRDFNPGTAGTGGVKSRDAGTELALIRGVDGFVRWDREFRAFLGEIGHFHRCLGQRRHVN